MPKVPGVGHLAAIRALDLSLTRQSGHVVLKKGQSVLVVPRNNPIKSHTMGALVRAAGLTVEEFLELLK